jgi:hypothetical protein
VLKALGVAHHEDDDEFNADSLLGGFTRQANHHTGARYDYQ